jgi:hypothetical protein
MMITYVRTLKVGRIRNSIHYDIKFIEEVDIRIVIVPVVPF